MCRFMRFLALRDGALFRGDYMFVEHLHYGLDPCTVHTVLAGFTNHVIWELGSQAAMIATRADGYGGTGQSERRSGRGLVTGVGQPGRYSWDTRRTNRATRQAAYC